MARESITVQCYPSDSAVNAMVARYEAFGWELIGNQQFQENQGSGYDVWQGSVTRYSTYNKLTFSREKSAPWYHKVTELDRQCKQKEDEVRHMKGLEPTKPEFHNIVGVFLGVIGIWTLFIPFIIYMSVRRSKNKNYEKSLRLWHKTYDEKIAAEEREIESIKAQARRLVEA